MEFPELTKLAFSRVQKLEPENVGKVLGCILLREPDENEMIQLAYGTDTALLAKIAEAKTMLATIYARCSAQAVQMQQSNAATAEGELYQQLCSHPVSSLRHFSPAATVSFHVQSQYWASAQPASEKVQEFAQHAFMDTSDGHYSLRSQQSQMLGFDDHFDAAVNGFYYSDDTLHHSGGRGAAAAAGRRSNGLSKRPCHYFFKGICKNGQNCNYSHHEVYADGLAGEDNHGSTTPGSLEKLELEIMELLKARRGQPVSIASLPTLYGEKYGKGLQADGYLTESQRHGKAGYSLTKLLSRLNKIRVIERPHGQHSVVLAEDAAKYMDFRSDRSDTGTIPASSHQIYLTFPAESTFTEDDVANYFGQYGPVRDVRIPCQERRMFGFVSFQNPETVSTILMRRNPHFICGSRVLVKPYREKSKCIERTYMDKIKPMHYYAPRFFEIDTELYPGEYDASRLMRKQLAEKRDRLLELERRRLSDIRLESMPQYAYFNCSLEDLNALNSLPDSKELDSLDPLIFTADSLENVSTSQAASKQASNNYDDQDSNQIELLPESPFALAPAGNSISAII